MKRILFVIGLISLCNLVVSANTTTFNNTTPYKILVEATVQGAGGKAVNKLNLNLRQQGNVPYTNDFVIEGYDTAGKSKGKHTIKGALDPKRPNSPKFDIVSIEGAGGTVFGVIPSN